MAEKKGFLTPAEQSRERGQSIVLIALSLVGLLAFVGIAVDVGFVFARNTQLQSAVDAAALAAVVELVSSPTNSGPANVKATQFFNTNGLNNIVVTDPAQNQNTLGHGRSLGVTALGAIQYELSADLPVNLFFLRLIGRSTITLTRSAVAGVFPLTDIYASRRIEDGVLSTSNQSLFGPSICTQYGDPFSPLNSTWAPGPYTYEYRILLPPSYPYDIVRVELFDPDSINTATNTVTIQHTNYANTYNPGTYPLFQSMTCGTTQRDNCILNTLESNIPNVNPDVINPYWFVRIDENRGAGSGNGNGTCGQPGSYTPAYNTRTTYELFYWAQRPDGTLQRITLATYTGQAGDGVRDNGSHQTDMRWVAPGGQTQYDQPVNVPTDCGSPNGGDYDATACPSGSPAGAGSGFEVSISQDLGNILTDPANGNRFLYLNVTSISGASENGFELWAGPNSYVSSVSSDANLRNLQVLNQTSIHRAQGVTAFALGRLPMNSNTGNRVDIPLIYVGAEMVGQHIYVSLFDSDSGYAPPIHFFFDSISRQDWQYTFSNGGTDPDGVTASSRCTNSSCNNTWVTPAFDIRVPSSDTCDYTNTNATYRRDFCTPFYGGRLTASYQAGASDTYGWEIRTSGQPYLIR